jgi:hypothetical protein
MGDVSVESGAYRQGGSVFPQQRGAVAVDTRVRTCNICEAEIEVDEPLVVIEREGERETSLADEPDLRGRRDVMLLHAKCMPSAEPALATTHSEARLDHHVEELLAAFDELDRRDG